MIGKMICRGLFAVLVLLSLTTALSPPAMSGRRLPIVTETHQADLVVMTKDCAEANSETEGSALDSVDYSRRVLVGTLLGAGVCFGNTEESKAATVQETSLTPAQAAVDWNGILKKSSKRALGGGKAGAAAAVVQVCTLMWLRTSMNYQYRYGGNLKTSLETLWSQGGISRLYQGLPFALVQGPLTRFGDTAANVGVIALLESLDATRDLPLPVKTAFGSIAAGAWRIVLMPVDASKTAMQVEGAEGLERLRANVLERGPGVLYRGAVAQAAATTAGHFPWFLTYNFLNEQLPQVSSESDLLLFLLRSAFLGLSASCVSDCISNSLRVLKTTKQTSQLSTDGEDLSYSEIAKQIIEKDGVVGLLGRGLQTRLLTNAIQGAVFSVCWKYFQQFNGSQ
jgi:hypothetical protein